MYDTESILCDLNMNLSTLKQMAVLSGTDYTTSSESVIPFEHIIDWYSQYKNENMENISQKEYAIDFYDWLIIQKYINDRIEYDEIIRMFEMDETSIDISVKMQSLYIHISRICTIMKPYGFIFL